MIASGNFGRMLRTARDLALKPGPALPFGEALWGRSHRVRFPSPVVSVSGRFGREVVYCTRGETCYWRSYVTPADPKTFRQLDERVGMTGIQGDWKNLTAAERDGWTAYAKQHFTPEKGFYFRSPGQNLYLKTQTPRTAWGDDPSHAPPALPPPPAPLALIEEAAPAAGQVAFRVEHDLEDWEGYRFELRMCPATINGRKPQETHFCRAGLTAAGSFFPLGESGTLYLMEAPRFDVAPGERFGLGVRVMTPDGVPGPELRVDLTRMEWNPAAATGAPAGAVEEDGGSEERGDTFLSTASLRTRRPPMRSERFVLDKGRRIRNTKTVRRFRSPPPRGNPPLAARIPPPSGAGRDMSGDGRPRPRNSLECQNSTELRPCRSHRRRSSHRIVLYNAYLLTQDRFQSHGNSKIRGQFTQRGGEPSSTVPCQVPGCWQPD